MLLRDKHYGALGYRSATNTLLVHASPFCAAGESVLLHRAAEQPFLLAKQDGGQAFMMHYYAFA